ASQGLLLMIPNMYKIAGELLPAVFHVSARALASHALSIFGDHQDVMACRQTGFAMLASGGVQEVMDLSAVSHLVAIRSRVPFVNFFDGFRTSHEIQKIELIEQDELAPLIDREALQQFRNRALNPANPVTRGTAQNPDIYFQAREACNRYYDAVPDMVAEEMEKISKITGRTYKPFNYYGAADAERVIVAMGSITETIREVVDFLMAKGEKVGVVSVHLYRPFSAKHFMAAMPETVKTITVLDRTKEPGAVGEPLYLDVKSQFYGKENAPKIMGGRYGLSSKDTTPAQMLAVFENMNAAEPKEFFTVGINDDVTYLSLPVGEEISLAKAGTFEGRFIGLGADGTVGANKNSIKIIGETTDKYCQAYFSYDSKKSGGYTSSHLRFGDEPITSPYLVTTPDFVACHVPSYIGKYDLLKGLKDGGTFLLNSVHDAETTKASLPNDMKKYLADHKINFYIINATKIASEIGLGNRTNTIMQSAFFKVADVIPYEQAVEQMKKFIYKSYGKKGEDIVNMNYAAVDRGGDVEKVEVPAEWSNLTVETVVAKKNQPEFIEKVVNPINALEGDSLPVSTFLGREDGTWDAGTSKYEKRGIASAVPEWSAENCIQCNQCALICPHAAIRPFLLTAEEAAGVPEGAVCADGKAQLKEYKFRIQVSPMDCTGCNNCVNVCPAPQKALVMKPLETQMKEQNVWSYMNDVVGYKDQIVDKTKSVKNMQFAQPLFEFSGACAGCGETPYIKGITQLFGERMMVANATGCSSIYGGSAPSTPYCTNAKGRGPAWANSLFEDNAEFGLGMKTANTKLRERVADKMRYAIAECNCCSAELKGLMQEWLDNMNDGPKTMELSEKLIPMMEACNCNTCKDILAMKQYLVKASQWIFGGDGWGYDIGYGGLDHVLASGENVNIMVIDTEVYSNTGGQSSKATPIGAVAKFASSGKRVRKKDLGAIAMTYGYVYVAQVALGANQNQYLQAVKEAEAYDGPSLIIAYAPCINHGIKGGMTNTQAVEKAAVECGYWHLWRFNPAAPAGNNPFTLDSKEPDWSKFQKFINGEVRYSSLLKLFPEQAQELFEASEENAKWRYNSYLRFSKMEY
ncbi:MAG: pyruvate:ferredoxin (flavodoxin) oxidoreductase, partial [Rikenellaceae bacterium]|nr:pyruvate:ferredoxin (flavodoxin) oxidoreductase [Rikenellaceae bacterium]